MAAVLGWLEGRRRGMPAVWYGPSGHAVQLVPVLRVPAVPQPFLSQKRQSCLSRNRIATLPLDCCQSRPILSRRPTFVFVATAGSLPVAACPWAATAKKTLFGLIF